MNSINIMEEGWTECNIGELVDLAQGVAINAKTNHVLSDKENGIPLLKINNLLNNTIDQYANPDLVPKQSIIHKNDVIFTRTGQVGEVLKNKYGILHNNSFKVIPNEKLYWNYLYWYLKSNKVYNYVQKVAAGSVQKDLNHSAFKTISLKYPKNIEEQKAISNVLTAFDDKIELLQQQNQTLETIAQTIFKEWFGKYQLGDELPDGWRVGKLCDVGKIICGKTPSKSNENYFGNDIPFIKIPDMHNKMFILETTDNLSIEGAMSQNNKMLPKDSICISCIATVGLVSITTKNSQTNQQINSIVPKNLYYREFLYFILTEMKKYLNDLGSGGTATLNVNTSTFSNIELIIPTENKLQEFHILENPIFQKVLDNNAQIQSLTKTRDTLLPKLMGGQVRVKM